MVYSVIQPPPSRVSSRVDLALTETDAAIRSREDSLVALLRATAQGSEAAFAELYDATRRRVFGLTLRILRDARAAEDAAFEAYWTIWQRARDFDPARGAPMTWVLTIARSRAIDLLRARGRRDDLLKAAETPAALQDDRPMAEAEDELVSAERCAQVRAALEALPHAQRLAIETAYFAGLSHAETAAALGEPLGTIKSRIRLGLTTLRRQLSAEE